MPTQNSIHTAAATPAIAADRPAGTASRLGVAVVLGAQLMLALDTTIVNVALPRIGPGLGFSPAALSWVLNAYTLAFGGLLLLGGRLGDTYGRRLAFQAGLGLFTVASLLGGLAQTPELLIAARAIQGVGAALAAPGVLALLATSAPNQAGRHRALALFSAVSIGGATLGLILGGLLTEYASWRSTLFINVPIGLTAVMLSRRHITETQRRPNRFDVIGALSATAAAVSVVWALIGAPDYGWTHPRTISGLALGAVLLAILTLTERRVREPLLHLGLLRNRHRLAGLTITGIVFGTQMSIFFLIVQYVQQVLHFGALGAGLAFTPMTLGIFAMSRITPRLVARLGQTPLLVTGTLGLTASYLWLSGISPTGSYQSAVLGPLLLNGVAAGLTFMPAASLVLGEVDPEQAGSASGLLQTIQQLGGAIGLAVIVSIYAAGSVPGTFIPGVRTAMIATAALALTACVTATTATQPRRRR
ncbi:MFS transporter [Micromonospora sp. DR5-3]|uniref:MFS transporter n=1 Tax=unclassified Micromonospora TaxID=2617518 RepID=UPI0011DBD869|nr:MULTISPECIES: MFS transporter [unclassified Micromonospora]MCW3819568.1 MFS transporter [Micromonospora sp. DR5-3]TYC19978.1 MFS transporter [Micromonospora sp. MP36]